MQWSGDCLPGSGFTQALKWKHTHTHTQAVTNFYSIERKNKSFKKQDSSSTNTNVNLFQPKNDPYTDQNNNNLPA